MRQPLEAQAGQNTVVLNNLTAGNVYTVVVVGAAEGQQGTFRFNASPALRSAASDLSALPGKNNALRFTAPGDQAVFSLQAGSPHQVSSIPFFLSVKCESCAETAEAHQAFLNQLAPPPIQTTQGNSPAELISNVLIGGNCFNVNNITSFGNALSRGTFNNGLSSINIQEGMIMATGRTNVVEGAEANSVAVGLVLLADIPRRPKVRQYDYVSLIGYPAGQYVYDPLPGVRKPIRRFAGGLEKAITLNLQSGAH